MAEARLRCSIDTFTSQEKKSADYFPKPRIGPQLSMALCFTLRRMQMAIGYEKEMDEKGSTSGYDLTTILAKANTIIYFSSLFKDNNTLSTIKTISQELLNDTVILKQLYRCLLIPFSILPKKHTL